MGIAQSFLRVPSDLEPERLEDWVQEQFSDMSWYAEALASFRSRDDWANARAVTLHKYFQAVQFCLTGEAWGGELPLGYLTVGGRELESIELEIPPRYLAPAEVSALAAALVALGEEGVRAQIDAQAMAAAGITADADHDPDTLLSLYRALVSFVQSAAERSEGLVVSISM